MEREEDRQPRWGAVEMPAGAAGCREERRGGVVEHSRSAAVDSLLERTSGREAFGEDERIRYWAVGLVSARERRCPDDRTPGCKYL